jgi:hypothetical protein
MEILVSIACSLLCCLGSAVLVAGVAFLVLRKGSSGAPADVPTAAKPAREVIPAHLSAPPKPAIVPPPPPPEDDEDDEQATIVAPLPPPLPAAPVPPPLPPAPPLSSLKKLPAKSSGATIIAFDDEDDVG